MRENHICSRIPMTQFTQKQNDYELKLYLNDSDKTYNRMWTSNKFKVEKNQSNVSVEYQEFLHLPMPTCLDKVLETAWSLSHSSLEQQRMRISLCSTHKSAEYALACTDCEISGIKHTPTPTCLDKVLDIAWSLSHSSLEQQRMRISLRSTHKSAEYVLACTDCEISGIKHTPTPTCLDKVLGNSRFI